MSRAHELERGQVIPLVAVVMVMVLLMAVGIAAVGAVIVERHVATVAADATALASTHDGAGGFAVADWYRTRGIDVQVEAGRSRITLGDSTAQSQAVPGDGLRVAPAVVAILARAEQLLGRSLEPVGLEATSVTFSESAAAHFATVAADLGMCVSSDEGAHHRFALC